MKNSFLLLLAAIVWSSTCRADDWYQVVPYACDLRHDQVTIKFFGNWNEEGLSLLKQYSSLNNLSRTVGPNDKPGPNWQTLRTCKLSGGEVRVISGPVWPGPRGDGSGECGVWGGGIKVSILFAGKEIGSYPLEENCHASDVISSIIVRGRDGNVVATRTSKSDWYPK